MNYARIPLAQLAISIPTSTSLLRKRKLDFSFNGKETLEEACRKKNVDLNALIAELRELEQEKEFCFETGPLGNITRYIVNRYHVDLKKRLPHLITLASKVESVHIAHKDCPVGLTESLKNFEQNLFHHMMIEETILFPMIENDRISMASRPVLAMMQMHESHAQEIEELTKMTNNFIPPADACTTWRSLYTGLEELEEELLEHVHIENNILFPRALALGQL